MKARFSGIFPITDLVLINFLSCSATSYIRAVCIWSNGRWRNDQQSSVCPKTRRACLWADSSNTSATTAGLCHQRSVLSKFFQSLVFYLCLDNVPRHPFLALHYCMLINLKLFSTHNWWCTGHMNVLETRLIRLYNVGCFLGSFLISSLIIMAAMHMNLHYVTGMDYQIPPTPIELEFATTESRLPVSLNIFDDAILEGPENFILFLTIPANPVSGYGLGRISSTTIRILDNDGNNTKRLSISLRVL